VGRKLGPIGISIVIFAVILITITTIRLTGLGSSFFNPVGEGMTRVLAPVEGFLWNLGDGIKKNARAIFRFNDVRKENEELRRQVEQLTGDNLLLRQQVLAGLRYNELDQGQFKSPTWDKFAKKGASVVNRNPNAWYQTITINKGAQDGIKVNDPVVAYTGLVGKVVSLTSKTAEILLILDGEGQVASLVYDSQGRAIHGILSGTYKRDTRLLSGGSLQMDFKQEDEVNVGDLVLTSGLGQLFPKDIPIGVVTSVRLSASGLLKTAYLDPVVNFDALEEVFVITMGKE